MRKLEFMAREVIVAPPIESKSQDFEFEKDTITEATILFLGLGCILGYKVGDTILYEKGNLAENKKLLGFNYIRMPESHIICRVS
jgi:hypothetical protein